MAMRSIQDRFWSDGWVRKLNPLDRYLFLYFLTNDKTSWCGVYELDLAMVAFECGIDKEDLQNAMLPRLAPKVIYVDGWVFIPNWMKHHLSTSGTVSPQHKKGFDDAWKAVPERIRLKIKEIQENGYPMQGVSPSSIAIASSFASAFSIEEAPQEDGKPLKEKKEPKDGKGFETFWGMYPRKENKVGALAIWRALSVSERNSATEDVRVRPGTKDWKKDNGKYIPLAKNYLTEKRWEDEGVKTTTNAKYEKYA